MEIVSVPVIVAAVCGVIELLKGVFRNSEKFLRLIPIISAVFGAVAGVVIFFAAPGIIPADNAFMALLIGIASGLASTGCHQVVKQLKREETSVAEEEKKDCL